MWSWRSSLLLVGALLLACDEGRCVRSSDCATGRECLAGQCLVRRDDAGVQAGDAGEPAGDAGEPVADAAGAEADGARRPDAGAAPDAGDDGGGAAWDGGDGAIGEEDRDGGALELDASVDASI